MLGSKKNPDMKKSIDSRFPITTLRVDIAASGNGTVIFMEKGDLVHPRLRGTNMVTKYELKEGSFVIPNKISHINDETLVQVVKLASYAIRKNEGNFFLYCAYFIFYIFNSPYLYLQIIRKTLIPSVKFTWDLKPSYANNVHHPGK